MKTPRFESRRGKEGKLTIRGLSPARAEHVKVRTADTAVGDLNVDVVLSPLLGLECAPFHLSVDTVGAVAEPSFELDVGHDCVCCVVIS